MLAVFVNTSDGFADCWGPFFTLLARYGSTLSAKPIYLNTERCDFTWPGLDIQTTKVWYDSDERRPTWSQCLRRGIEAVSEPYILYLQEDYFLVRQINESLIQLALKQLTSDPGVGVVYLNKYGPIYRSSRSYSDDFIEIVPPCRYLASTQAAIWRKDVLLSLIRDWENGWMFEIFASRRALRSRFRFLTLDPQVVEATPAVDYVYTGVIKGKWKAECISLFAEEGITVDFSRRGIYRESGRLKSRIEVGRKLAGEPLHLLRSIRSLSKKSATTLHPRAPISPQGGLR